MVLLRLLLCVLNACSRIGQRLMESLTHSIKTRGCIHPDMSRRSRRTAQEWIQILGLQPIGPSIGWMKPTLSSNLQVEDAHGHPRSCYSSIYYLQKQGQANQLHALQSDELFFHLDGHPLTIVHLDEEVPGQLVKQTLSMDHPLVRVAGGKFRCQYFEDDSTNSGGKDKFAVFSVVVAPGFDPADSMDGDKSQLEARFPEAKEFIQRHM